MDDLEARVSALEAAQADYRAVLSAIHALGANQRDHSLRLNGVEDRLTQVGSRLTSVEVKLTDFHTESHSRFRSVDEQLSEIKDLILRGPR